MLNISIYHIFPVVSDELKQLTDWIKTTEEKSKSSQEDRTTQPIANSPNPATAATSSTTAQESIIKDQPEGCLQKLIYRFSIENLDNIKAEIKKIRAGNTSTWLWAIHRRKNLEVMAFNENLCHIKISKQHSWLEIIWSYSMIYSIIWGF